MFHDPWSADSSSKNKDMEMFVNGPRFFRHSQTLCDEHHRYSVAMVTVVCNGCCNNGGSCVGPGKCSCALSYGGPRCEDTLCALPCQHGGHCVGAGGWQLTAPPLYPLHQSSVCEPPCRHGGQCVRPHTCHCPRGTSGDFCQN
nr:unnamed protein product [Timema californicum]